MNGEELSDIKSIAKHVKVLNSDMGYVQTDIKWIKKVIGYMAIVISAGVGKFLFL